MNVMAPRLKIPQLQLGKQMAATPREQEMTPKRLPRPPASARSATSRDEWGPWLPVRAARTQRADDTWYADASETPASARPQLWSQHYPRRGGLS
jgi:hypothetical protein